VASAPGYSGNDSYGETGLESERAALTFGKRYLESGGSVENARARSEMNPGPWTLKLTAGAGRRTGAPELADGNRLSGGSSLEYELVFLRRSSTLSPSGSPGRTAWTASCTVGR
jgi:hypothetical protein